MFKKIFFQNVDCFSICHVEFLSNHRPSCHLELLSNQKTAFHPPSWIFDQSEMSCPPYPHTPPHPGIELSLLHYCGAPRIFDLCTADKHKSQSSLFLLFFSFRLIGISNAQNPTGLHKISRIEVEILGHEIRTLVHILCNVWHKNHHWQLSGKSWHNVNGTQTENGSWWPIALKTSGMFPKKKVHNASYHYTPPLLASFKSWKATWTLIESGGKMPLVPPGRIQGGAKTPPPKFLSFHFLGKIGSRHCNYGDSNFSLSSRGSLQQSWLKKIQTMIWMYEKHLRSSWQHQNQFPTCSSAIRIFTILTPFVCCQNDSIIWSGNWLVT